MQLRAARTLVFTRQDGALLGCNFLTRDVFGCDSSLLDLLAETPEWTDAQAIIDGVFEGDAAEVESLIRHSALTVAGSALARREDEYLAEWQWTIPTGMLHFCLEDAEIISLEESEEIQRQRIETEPQPALYLRNRDRVAVVPLPEARKSDALLDIMARRRTVRAAASPSISLAQLSDCLFAGMGITGETSNVVGTLPLGMTPSGGARNPYEAYVFARRVDGLEPGIYHYSAIDHDLGLVRRSLPKFSQLVGGQDWADEMPCLLVLVADFRRTMWKYRDPNAYRVVLIEAGHIGQNVMLAATRHGLSACPTAALAQARIRKALGLRRLTDAPVYAMTLAVPGNEPSVTLQ
jgi:SagB-type dehydrogenase family enzyme